MKYKRLGKTGLLVSEMSFGTWINFSAKSNITHEEQAYNVMKTAFEAGVNFFDCAEVYADGEAEIITGKAFRMGLEEKLWKRSDLVLSTKLFFGAIPEKTAPEYNKFQRRENRIGLSRKHIFEGMKDSLERMGLDYVDLVFAHRFDPLTEMEEVVRGFNFLIDQGYAFYWGTSEWTAQQIQEAKTVAARLGLIGPSMEQPEYNLLHRDKVDRDYKGLYPGLGLTIWSPLASGILTGKYKDGVPEGSRMATAMFKKTAEGEKMRRGVTGTEKLRPIAEKIGCTLPQLALAWCMSNPNVSTTIGGASSVEQVKENLKAVEFIDKLTPEILREMDEIFPRPELSASDRHGWAVRSRDNNLRHINYD